MTKEYKFKDWYRWDTLFTENEEVQDVLSSPGVYALAHFAKGELPEAGSHKISARRCTLLLIAGTTDQTLRERLKQFENEVKKNTGKHAGGRNYQAEFETDKISPKLGASLLPLPASEVERVKRDLLNQYEDKYGMLPILNKQN